MLPEVLLVIPLYIYVVELHLADTLLSLIISNTAFTLPLTFWFMRSYFNAIPASLEESAMIDGCTRLRACSRDAAAGPSGPDLGRRVQLQSLLERVPVRPRVHLVRAQQGAADRARHLDRPGHDLLVGHAAGGRRAHHAPRLLFYLLVQRHLVVGPRRPAGSRVNSCHPSLAPTLASRTIHERHAHRAVEAIADRDAAAQAVCGSRYNVTSRNMITRIDVAGGLVSEVYNGDNRHHGREIVHIIEHEIAPLDHRRGRGGVRAGLAPIFPVATWHKDRGSPWRRSPAWTPRSGTSSARRGVNVCRLLGGYRPAADHRIGGYYQEGKTLLDLGKEMERLREAGIAGCKVKVGGLSAEQDPERVARRVTAAARTSSSRSMPTAAGRSARRFASRG